jgi:hypothetical protein
MLLVQLKDQQNIASASALPRLMMELTAAFNHAFSHSPYAL